MYGTSTACNSTCADPSQICGGSDAISVYQFSKSLIKSHSNDGFKRFDEISSPFIFLCSDIEHLFYLLNTIK